MKDNRLEQRIQHSLNTELSGLNTTSWQRNQFFENATGGNKVKRKLTYSLVLAIVLLLIAATALAVALLSPKEIVEQVAVPVAQNNDHENYTHEELAELIRTLNENGITLDEGSRIMRAFNAGHGYWEQDTIREICIAAFGDNERGWNIEQKHWYGEMMVAVGAWDRNDYLLPGEGDLTEQEARKLAVKALKDAYNVDLPMFTNEDWLIGIGFSSDYYDEGEDSYWIVEWHIGFSRTENLSYLAYGVDFERHGENVQTVRYDEPELNGWALDRYQELMTNASKEQEAMKKYGEIMYFWPDEVKVEVYGATGLPYAIPEQAELDQALEDTKRFICEKYGPDALEKLGDYKVGYLFQRLDDEEDTETKMLQLMWDIVITTDPEFLSDGYRVQFQRIIHHENKEEEITDLIVEQANLGNG